MRGSKTLEQAASVERLRHAAPVSGSPFNAGTCRSTVPPGTIGNPGPDNLTIASAGKFMCDNCGIYSIDESTGAITQVSSQGPREWPVIDPRGLPLGDHKPAFIVTRRDRLFRQSDDKCVNACAEFVPFPD